MPAARAARATFGGSLVKSRRTPLPIVWKCTGSPLAATASHIGFHHGSHDGVMSPRREISSPRVDGTLWAPMPLAPALPVDCLHVLQHQAGGALRKDDKICAWETSAGHNQAVEL